MAVFWIVCIECMLALEPGCLIQTLLCQQGNMLLGTRCKPFLVHNDHAVGVTKIYLHFFLNRNLEAFLFIFH